MAGSNYYYAAGKRIPLALDEEYVAVDLPKARQALGPAAEKVQAAFRTLRANTVMGKRSDLSQKILSLLEAASALHPVYREGDVQLVALPEVRVEMEKSQHTRVLGFFQECRVPVSIERDEDEMAVVKPTSGKGADAVALANDIYEQIHPKAAQVRFLRVVPKPNTEHVPWSGGAASRRGQA